jgi:hypothetical protein
MSLGGPPSEALDDAVPSSAGSGVVYAVTAENSAANASNHTEPAGEAEDAELDEVGARD